MARDAKMKKRGLELAGTVLYTNQFSCTRQSDGGVGMPGLVSWMVTYRDSRGKNFQPKQF